MANPLPLPLLLEDQRQSWRRGERVWVEQIQQRWGTFDAEAILDLIYNEVYLREERGETPTLAEYQERFPQYALALQIQFEVHQEIASTMAEPASVIVHGAPVHLWLVDETDGAQILLGVGVLTLGRNRTSDVKLSHPKASREHCRILAESGQLFLEDLGSRTGTKLNGRRVDRAKLKPGDRIEVPGKTYRVQGNKGEVYPG